MKPDYLHDANAVIALLEKERLGYEMILFSGAIKGRYRATIFRATLANRDAKDITRTEETFCRAAVRALLAAHGAEEKQL